jgi:hypothetical protein
MNELPELRPGQWNLLVLPRGYRNRLLIAAAHLAERGPLTVLDCGRQYDATVVARAARGRIEVMDRIHSQRAFICYEVARLLQKTPAGNAPVLVLDLLSTFYDENVQIRMRQFLLENSIQHLQRLSRGAGLAVSVDLPPTSPDSLHLFERLQSAASQVLTYEVPAPASRQLGLF